MKYLLTIGLLLLSFCLSAQTFSRYVIPAAGHHEKNGVSLSYTIGESITETFTSQDDLYTLTQGFLQAQVMIMNSSEEKSLASFEMYPNPTRNVIYLKLGDMNPEDFIFQVFNIDGRMLDLNEKTAAFESSIMEFDISEFEKGTYLFRIIDKKKSELVATYKVLKIY